MNETGRINPYPTKAFSAGKWRRFTLGLTAPKARSYSSALGRFLQTDPIGTKDDLNLYAYTHNDPMNEEDPTGDCGTGTNISGTDAIGCTGGPDLQQHDGSSSQSSQHQSNSAASRIGRTALSLIPGYDLFKCDHSCLTKDGSGLNGKGWLAAAGLFGIIPGLGEEVEGAEFAATVFKTEHYAPRLEKAGIDVERAETAVRDEVAAMRPNMSTGHNVRGRISVDGVKIEYRARLRPNGTVEVGTIHRLYKQ